MLDTHADKVRSATRANHGFAAGCNVNAASGGRDAVTRSRARARTCSTQRAGLDHCTMIFPDMLAPWMVQW